MEFQGVKSDTIFHLGDFSFLSFNHSKNLLDKLNGNIHLIMGNHDKYRAMSKMDRFQSINDLKNIYILDEELGKDKYQEIILCHYPLLSWNRQHYGS